MTSLFHFLRATLTGGILFMLPMVLVIMIFNKARLILVTLSAPLAKRMPELIIGLDGSNLLAIFLLVMICFVSGLVFRSMKVRSAVRGLEDGLLSYVPGYALLKSIAADAIGTDADNKMATVLVNDGETWNVAFLVEENKEYCTVFIPEAPRHDSGEVKIVPTSWVRKTDVPTSKAARSLKTYGKGVIAWMETHNLRNEGNQGK